MNISPKIPILMLTCEHACNKVPAAFKDAVPTEVLETHRGYDIGARMVYRKLVNFAKPEFHCEGKFSRLFVDLNRTITNKSAFSEFYEKLDADNYCAAEINKASVAEKRKASATAAAKKCREQATAYWTEYRENIEKFVSKNIGSLRQAQRPEAAIVHLGIHSFTPVLNGKARNADIGILYDPSRPAERELAQVIRAEIKRQHPEMKVRFNYPYKGTSDGLTTTLRKKYGPQYAGLEIEINQKFFL